MLHILIQFLNIICTRTLLKIIGIIKNCLRKMSKQNFKISSQRSVKILYNDEKILMCYDRYVLDTKVSYTVCN